MRILVVDDDLELCAALSSIFQSQDFDVKFEQDGDGGLASALAGGFDLLILDVVIPKLDGFEVLRCLREHSHLPVLMLTGREEQCDRVRGLQLGADDCLSKPFDPEELLARVRAILRRVSAAPGAVPGILQVGELTLAPGAREVWFRGKKLELTAMECEILEALMRSRGSVVSRDQLSLQLYQRRTSPFDRSVDTHISRIRRKIGEGRKMILSVRGSGYQLRYPPESEP